MDVREQVDAYELAMLAGGAERCVEAALAGLVVAGAVRVSRDGRLTAVEPHATHPVEVAVLDALAAGSRPVALEKDPEAVQARAALDARVTAVRDALVRRGLLRCSLRWWLTAPAAACRLTTAGRRLVDSERRQDPAGMDTTRAVALLGAEGIPDVALREALFRGAPSGGGGWRRERGSASGWVAGMFGGGCGSDGGASGCGGHSGCGGSSGCGGGGCGGCGGS